MFDAKQNNWILDTSLEAPNYAAQVALNIRCELEEPPVFNQMQEHFWFELFVNKHFKTLQATARKLGYGEAFSHKDQYIGALTKYFQELVR